MYNPSSQNKGADQLRGYREADLRLCFRLCRLLVFPWGGSNVIMKEKKRKRILWKIIVIVQKVVIKNFPEFFVLFFRTLNDISVHFRCTLLITKIVLYMEMENSLFNYCLTMEIYLLLLNKELTSNC